jgi:hypothetical protein
MLLFRGAKWRGVNVRGRALDPIELVSVVNEMLC